MTTPSAPEILLSDYQPPAYLVDNVHLVFDLDPTDTQVTATVVFKKNTGGDLWLDGRDLTLHALAIDGVDVDPAAFNLTDEGLTIPQSMLADSFTVETRVTINPKGNTALEGLYMSRGMYCTQCEAEGFRKITYYPDRPDVMAVFSVRINSDQPVMLSNGNPTAQGDGWAQWDDPWPKPAYLFALVAGDLVSFDDSFTTAERRDVALKIYVRDGDLDKCAYAMDALKRAMTWDEENYGRVYDLDLFNIVAVDDFNMGAMENKGLNIFNSALVLASPQTATDTDFARIESVIAHEYFHNWTGNRITCRDWFQLCLKEGLTVFRDQQFSGDMRDASVARIENVMALRDRQFREDAGPLAHPVRPEKYIEINNFYTATVYEKGAEVIGMLRRIVGPDDYRRALDLYFTRHDGQACTIEDWLQVFEDTTGRDLSQFKRWYSQAGTPVVTATEAYDAGVYRLTLEQQTPPTPGQPDKPPRVIPIAMGLLAGDGSEMRATEVLELTETKQSFVFDGLESQPIPSLLRGFSAPVVLQRATHAQEQAFLLANDTDPFNRWEAARRLVSNTIRAMALEDDVPDDGVLQALKTLVMDSDLDPAYRALLMVLPAEDELAKQMHERDQTPDPDAIHTARNFFLTALAVHFDRDAKVLFAEMNQTGPYSPDAASAGKRSLQMAMLALISRLDNGVQAGETFSMANNMTVQMAALSTLLSNNHGQPEVATFYAQWRKNKLVLDKWFQIQALRAPREAAVETISELADHPDFDMQNPNRFRALIGGFAFGNHAGFHAKDGTGYALVTDWLIRLDAKNPQTAARLAGAFSALKWYDAGRQAHMTEQLERILGTTGLSKNTGEIVGRILGE